jgi:hypothetical protein
LGNGTGIYKEVTADDNIWTLDFGNEGIIQNKSGPAVIFLPRDKNMVTVLGAFKDKRAIDIYEAILYVPGPCPQKI